MKVRLIVPLGELECARRNALTEKSQALTLDPGAIGSVLEVFEKGNRYMVEFVDADTGECHWVGVLRCAEIELIPRVARAA